jgi:hypothetical protein
MLENRRRHTRVPIQTEVTCTVRAQTIRGLTWNLSQGGMQVEAGGLEPKDTVRVSFHLPVSGVLIEAVGTVVLSGRSGNSSPKWKNRRLERRKIGGSQPALFASAGCTCLSARLALVRLIRRRLSILLFTQQALKFVGEGTRIDRFREVAIESRIQDVFPIASHGISMREPSIRSPFDEVMCKAGRPGDTVVSLSV